MGTLPKEEIRYTYAEYKCWELDEGERWELINGEAFAMARAGERHQSILGGLFGQFYNCLETKPCKVYPAPFDVRLFYAEDESDDTVVQPDIVVVCDEKKRGPESCHGAPDLAIEILSPSNTAIEMQRKFRLYRKAGVREYWVVDTKHNELAVHCFRDNTVVTDNYESTDTVPVTIFPGFSIDLKRVFA